MRCSSARGAPALTPRRPLLDCPDVLPPESSEPEWHGQMLTTIGETFPDLECRLAPRQLARCLLDLVSDIP